MIIDENEHNIKVMIESITKLKDFEQYLLDNDLLNEKTREGIRICKDHLFLELGSRVDKRTRGTK